MRRETIILGIIIFFVSIIVYFIKNNESIIKKIKRFKYANYSVIIVSIGVIICILFSIDEIRHNINLYLFSKENSNLYNKCDKLISDEKEYYDFVIDVEYGKNFSYSQPFIPEGFNYVEGKWDSGFIIEDEKGNQFVWVPCGGDEELSVPKLQKRYFSNNPLISIDQCYDLKYKDFLNSALLNGGFYISRYEIGKENNYPVSKQGAIVWTDITQEEAIKLSEQMYNNEIVNSSLINGYAYDTVIQWIKDSNITIIQNDIEINDNYYAGRKDYNHIYDLFDNILELTLEKNYDTVITRGMYNPDVFEKYEDLINRFELRFSILENSKYNYVGFRTVLYK